MAIEKRTGKDGKPAYRVRISTVNAVTHKRQNVTVGTYRRKSDAERAEREALLYRERGTLLDPAKLTVGALLDQWLDTKRDEVSDNVLTDYSIAIRRHILPALGTVPVQRLSTAALQAQVNAWRDGGMSPPYIAKIMLVMSQALTAAMNWNFVSRNVAVGIRKPSVRKRPATVWTPEELRRFLILAANDRLSPLWQLLASEGMRRGEALGLRWADVNWERGTVHIAQTVIADKHDRGAAKIQPRGKTATSSRQVKLTGQTLALLAEHQDLQRFVRHAAGDRWQDHDLIVSTSLGTPVNPANVSRSFNALIIAAGLPKIRLHDLRHTAASLMLRAGVPVKQISERLGHANVRITLDTYAHLMADAHDLAAEAMSRILTGDPQITGTDI